ncbi:MAG: SPOR domain-containing protein [Treponema sp.]|jgi:hypothetical protein|nr:SPOR domain-containing protein [Treponema sp.]
MKKRLILIASAALFALTNASVWEGSAAVAPGGDLPDTGYYAATNSFPRNTVVDVINLENGKSIRVIVASGLETPGLLAVLSKDAADLIGLPGRSIGRIRMTQPSDPVAFSRFTEGFGSSGDPDYDPKALVAGETVYSANPLAESPSRISQAYPGSRPAPGYVSEPEWENDSYYEVVDLPEESGASDEIVDLPERSGGPAPDEIVDLPEKSGDSPLSEIAGLPETPAESEETPAEPPQAFSYNPPVSEEDEGIYPEAVPLLAEGGTAAPDETEGLEDLPPEYFAPPENTETIAGIEGIAEPAADFEKPAEEEYDYVLVPAEERPPEYFPENLPEDSFWYSPSERDSFAEPEIIISSAPEPAPFSVPVIGSLEYGKYYVQLGAFSKAEAVESEISRIGKIYPLAVQNGGNGDKPLYRILLGPMNLGESGALLQRFKSIGYRDAFVRLGG